MRIYISGLFLIFCFISGAWSQAEYSADQYEVFVKIYMTGKVEAAKFNAKQESSLAKYEVNPQRYREIMKGELLGEKIALTEMENELVAEVKMQNKLREKQYEAWLYKSCLDHDFSYDDYKIILKKYKSEIAFQRSLQEYFTAYLQKQKK